jgi:hypothetical protein
MIARGTGAANVRRARGKRADRYARHFAAASGEIVKAAARLLDQEMAVGITTAKAIQQRLRKERRVDSVAFSEALQRLHADAQDVVNALDRQLDGSRARENTKLAKAFVARTNDLLDLVVDVVTIGADLANQLLQRNVPPKEAGRGRKSRG